MRVACPSFVFQNLLSEVEDVDVGAKADVVGQIVAFVVGIVVDDDLVAAPVPPGAVAYVKGSNTPEEAVEAEAVGAAAVEMPDVAATDAAGEMAVLPGVIEMVVGVVFTGVVTDPLAVVMNVGRFGMARFIGAVLFLWRRLGFLVGCGSVRGFETAADPIAARAAAVLFMLRTQKSSGCQS